MVSFSGVMVFLNSSILLFLCLCAKFLERTIFLSFCQFFRPLEDSSYFMFKLIRV